MSSLPPDYIDNTPLPIYYPRPFAASYPRTSTPTTSTGSDSSGGGSGTGGGGTTVTYAAALFINATCVASDVVGNWVRAADAANTVVTTTSGLSYPAIGVIVSKSSDTACVVQTYGLCSGVYSNLTPNVRLFVGPTGLATKGSDLPSGTAYVQPIAFSVRSNTVFVQPSGTLYRRDAAPASNDPAPVPSGDTTSTYKPLLHGEGVPSADIGQAGDAYLAVDSLYLYQRGSDGWDNGTPIVSATPTQGPAGEPGSKIYRVASFPADGSGYANGDILIDDQGNLAQVENS